MKPIDVVIVLLLVAVVVVLRWRRRGSPQPQQAASSEMLPKAPAAEVISLHRAAKGRRRPF